MTWEIVEEKKVNTDLIHGVMLIWKERCDRQLDADEIKDFLHEDYVRDLLFDLRDLCEEYAVDFDALIGELND